MNVGQCMKQEVITAASSATVAEAANLFNNHHVGMLPVLDEQGHLVGILNLRDLLDLIMPVFVKLIDDFDYVGDFGVLENKQPSKELLDQLITSVMGPPISVSESSGLLRAFAILHRSSGLLRAFAILHRYELLDLPIVDRSGRLVGLASRVDVGRALMSGWRLDTGVGGL
jgi:CBS domain-containing protein